MSADNWSICPKCLEKHNEERTAAKEKAQALYGKVSSAKYAELLASATAAPAAPAEAENSLREDYEIGVNILGEFFVCYGCSCKKCGFEFIINLEKQALK